MKTNSKNILTAVINTVIFGIIFWLCSYAGDFIDTLLPETGLSQLGYEPFYGIYCAAAVFAVYVVRKPGAAFLAELAAAVIETALSGFAIPEFLIYGVVQGLAIEAVFCLTKYQKYDFKTLTLAGAVCAAVTMVYEFFAVPEVGFYAVGVPMLALVLAIRVVSVVVFTGLLVPVLVKAFVKESK